MNGKTYMLRVWNTLTNTTIRSQLHRRSTTNTGQLLAGKRRATSNIRTGRCPCMKLC